MSTTRDQKSRGPRKPDRAPKGGKPAGKSFGQTGDKPRGKPAGKSFDKPRRVLRAPQAETPSTFAGERIAKVMARVGLCSRRDAELWISQGRVAVNGQKLDSPAVNVTPEDRITVDGKPLAERERTRLFMFHKPRGFVTTDRDPEGRPTIFDALPEGLPRLISIGRLDINTEGLLLLTNDGGLARVLELPSTGWLRKYRVRANGKTDQAQLDELRKGIVIEGIEYAGIEAHLDRVQGANVWLTMGLREGKNREIKRVLEHLGLAVNRLIRLSYGPFQLGDLEDGAIDEVRTRVLMEQLGPALSDEAGCDFTSPIVDRSGREEPADDMRPTRAPRGKMRIDEEEPAPRKDRPAPRTRKHVSVLRATREEPRQERRRIERAETADRKGRSVAVERVIKPGKKNLDTRNGRRFAAEDKDPRARRDATAGERPRTGRNAKDAQRDMDRRGMRPRREEFVSEPREFKPWDRDGAPAPRGPKPERDFKRGDRPQRSGSSKPPFKGGKGGGKPAGRGGPSKGGPHKPRG